MERQKLLEGNETYKKGPKENFITEDSLTKIKNSLHELNGKMKMKRKRVSELEDRLVEIIESEKQKKIGKKMNRVLGFIG